MIQAEEDKAYIYGVIYLAYPKRQNRLRWTRGCLEGGCFTGTWGRR